MALAFPTIFLLDAHLPSEKYRQIEQQIPTLTHDIKKAKLVVGKVTTKQRAQFELRCKQIWTEDVAEKSDVEAIPAPATPPRKRPRVRRQPSTDSEKSSASSTETEGGESPTIAQSSPAEGKTSHSSVAASFASQEDDNIFRVVKLAWVEDCLKAGVLLPLDAKYLVYEGRQIPKPNLSNTSALVRPRQTSVR